MNMEVRDDVIWFKHLREHQAILAAVQGLAEGQAIMLKVDGVVGKWVRMRSGKDGRPTFGIKPEGAMAKTWAGMQKRRGQFVNIELDGRQADPFLVMADKTFVEWYSAEDEEAYRDLQPL